MAERQTGRSGERRGDESTRSPFERPIALLAPLLDLVLWAGDRISRVAGPVDHEYYPVRSPDREDPEGGASRGKDDR